MQNRSQVMKLLLETLGTIAIIIGIVVIIWGIGQLIIHVREAKFYKTKPKLPYPHNNIIHHNIFYHFAPHENTKEHLELIFTQYRYFAAVVPLYLIIDKKNGKKLSYSTQCIRKPLLDSEIGYLFYLYNGKCYTDKQCKIEAAL